ncbi:MAG TPA: HPF/RaiA family ribosome-associated protein [Patescibacteria group bacterium]|nr:HPF/RaiA family ribosome-associated protein [Patescibacteria group bacterium]
MRLIIRGKGQFKVPADLAEYAKEKILKYEKRLPKSSILELELEDNNGQKGGLDKICQLIMVIPHEKNPIHYCERSESFRKSIDLVLEKLEREVEEYKEKRKPYF